MEEKETIIDMLDSTAEITKMTENEWNKKLVIQPTPKATIASTILERYLKSPGDILALPKDQYTRANFGMIRTKLARYIKDIQKDISFDFKEDGKYWYIKRL